MRVILRPKTRPCLSVFVDVFDARLTQIIVSISIENILQYGRAQRARLINRYSSRAVCFCSPGAGGALGFPCGCFGVVSHLCMSPLWLSRLCPHRANRLPVLGVPVENLEDECSKSVCSSTFFRRSSWGWYRTNNTNKLQCVNSERTSRKSIFLP